MALTPTCTEPTPQMLLWLSLPFHVLLSVLLLVSISSFDHRLFILFPTLVQEYLIHSGTTLGTAL